jgi:hypothetical protein
MKKWEYEVIAVQVSPSQEFVQKSITEVLNEAGANGWELVRMDLRPIGSLEYYECILKREKPYASIQAQRYH